MHLCNFCPDYNVRSRAPQGPPGSLLNVTAPPRELLSWDKYCCFWTLCVCYHIVPTCVCVSFFCSKLCLWDSSTNYVWQFIPFNYCIVFMVRICQRLSGYLVQFGSITDNTKMSTWHKSSFNSKLISNHGSTIFDGWIVPLFPIIST